MKLQSKHLKNFSLDEYISKTEDIKDYVDNTFIPLDGRSISGSIALNNEDQISKLPGAIATGNGSIAVGSEFCNQTQINITAEELDELDLTTVNVGTKYYLTSSGILHKIILKSDEVKENQYVRWSQYDSFMWKILDIQIIKNYEKYKYVEGTDADGWTYRLLKSCKELRLEAEDMRNDFYENGYFKEMADGSKLIVVATKPDGTKIDIEVLNYTHFNICENYYKYQREVDEDEDYCHLRQWEDGINKLRG